MQDEEQEWDPDAANFVVQNSRIIQTESGTFTVGSSDWYGDGDDSDVGSKISLLPLNNKLVNAEGLFLNLNRPRGGVTVAAEIIA